MRFGGAILVLEDARIVTGKEVLVFGASAKDVFEAGAWIHVFGTNVGEGVDEFLESFERIWLLVFEDAWRHTTIHHASKFDGSLWQDIVFNVILAVFESGFTSANFLPDGTTIFVLTKAEALKGLAIDVAIVHNIRIWEEEFEGADAIAIVVEELFVIDFLEVLLEELVIDTREKHAPGINSVAIVLEEWASFGGDAEALEVSDIILADRCDVTHIGLGGDHWRNFSSVFFVLAS